jgi:hypothetical protein
MRKRQKASDLHREAIYLLPTTEKFSEAFPMIADISIRSEQTEIWRSPIAAVFGLTTMPGEFIDCKNPLCYSGGFALGQAIWNMVHSRKTEDSFSQRCRGHEGSPKGRRSYRGCSNFFHVNIRSKYRTETT